MTRAGNARKSLPAVLALGVIGICGLIGMLLSEGVLDGLFFLLAISPLGFGGANYLLQHQKSA